MHCFVGVAYNVCSSLDAISPVPQSLITMTESDLAASTSVITMAEGECEEVAIS